MAGNLKQIYQNAGILIQNKQKNGIQQASNKRYNIRN